MKILLKEILCYHFSNKKNLKFEILALIYVCVLITRTFTSLLINKLKNTIDFDIYKIMKSLNLYKNISKVIKLN